MAFTFYIGTSIIDKVLLKSASIPIARYTKIFVNTKQK